MVKCKYCGKIINNAMALRVSKVKVINNEFHPFRCIPTYYHEECWKLKTKG